MYKATIYSEATEDNYMDSLVGDVVNSWEEVLTADTQSELRNKILEATYTEWKDLNDEQINDYDWCTEYHTSYLTNEDNQGKAYESEVKEWKKGKTKLYAVECHILVTEVTEKKASL
jgi:gas vesicle protein